MYGIWVIFRKEFASFFNSLTGYLVIGVFLVCTGLWFWVFEGNVLETQQAQMDDLFYFAPYMLLLVAPAVTMRAFSEERRSGTVELLFTRPLTKWQIILGKYFAALGILLLALLPTLLYYASVYWLALPAGNVDGGAIAGAYLGLAFIAALFAALGLLTSALTDSQILAFVLGAFLCFLFYLGFELIAGIRVLGPLTRLMLQLSILEHYRSISRGVLDSRDLLFFLSFAALALIGTRLTLDAQRR
jgi:ABC-2 type transport system permease protein